MPVRNTYGFLAIAFMALAFYSFGCPIIAGLFALSGSLVAIYFWFDSAEVVGVKCKILS